MAGIGDAPRRSMIAEDVRNLQRGTGQVRRGLRGRLHRRDGLLERAGDFAKRLEGDTGVERGRIELLVPEQHLDHADVGLLLERWMAKLCRSVCRDTGLSISVIIAARGRRDCAGGSSAAAFTPGSPLPPPACGPSRSSCPLLSSSATASSGARKPISTGSSAMTIATSGSPCGAGSSSKRS
jgi:hypothetical protein